MSNCSRPLDFWEKTAGFLFQSGVVFARIDGTDIYDDIIDSKQLSGRLPDIIEQCISLFKIHNKKSSVFVEGKRKDRQEYLARVFRELLVNAVFTTGFIIHNASTY